MNGFKCVNCHKWVSEEAIGTRNRNHCSYCLYSLHVDEKVGDRKSGCLGMMEPVGLTFKDEGTDKYGKVRQGELMIIHKCLKCGKICINRIAGDDEERAVMEAFERSLSLGELEGIRVLREEDRKEVLRQLYGSDSVC